MSFIVRYGDTHYGPFETAAKAAEWAMAYFAPHIIEKGLWSLLRVQKP